MLRVFFSCPLQPFIAKERKIVIRLFVIKCYFQTTNLRQVLMPKAIRANKIICSFFSCNCSFFDYSKAGQTLATFAQINLYLIGDCVYNARLILLSCKQSN